MAEQILARLRQGQLAPVALKERLLHRIFQPLHLQAERRLGDEHPFSGAQHRARIHDRREAAQQFRGQVYHHHPSYEPGS